MREYPSDLGHWERINESASAIDYSRELNMHTVVEDVCRALLDLNEAIRTAKADAWDEGFDTGATHGIAYQAGSNDSLPRQPGLNPYREVSHEDH